MNAKEFFREFNNTFTGEQRKTAEGCYKRSKAYTEFITWRISDILSREQSYQVSTEYYRVDIAAWSSVNPPAKGDALVTLKSYLWKLQVAVEHENNEKEWMDEVVKLAHICCPLRVVIGYLPMGDNHLANLNYVATALQELEDEDKNMDYLTHGEFLIIIGNSHTGKEPENYFHYKPYLYNAKSKRFELQESWL